MVWFRALAFAVVAVPSAAFAATPGNIAEDRAIPPTPVTISISDEGEQGFAIRHFPSRLRLYTFDPDPPGVSACFDGCAAAWPPVRANLGDKPVGEWTLVARSDGPPQWAYRGKPVYLRYHDRPQAPAGDGIDGVWHLIANIPRGQRSPAPR